MMGIFAALLFLGGTGVQGHEPPTPLSVAYSGVPGVVGKPPVHMQIHSATQTLVGARVVTESLTVLKNTSGKELAVQIALPWTSYCTNQDFLIAPSSLQATWDKVAVPLASDWRKLAKTPSGPHYRAKAYLASVKIKPNATHALRVRYETPLGRGGLDNLLRIVPYGVEGAADWAGAVDQFQLSLKFPPKAVLQVFSAAPDWGWQIGNAGAFLKSTAFAPTSPLLLFSFYPGGFQEIGGRNAKGGGGG